MYKVVSQVDPIICATVFPPFCKRALAVAQAPARCLWLLAKAERVGRAGLEVLPRVGKVRLGGVLLVVQDDVQVQSPVPIDLHEAAVVGLGHVARVLLEVCKSKRRRNATLAPLVRVRVRLWNENNEVARLDCKVWLKIDPRERIFVQGNLKAPARVRHVLRDGLRRVDRRWWQRRRRW